VSFREQLNDMRSNMWREALEISDRERRQSSIMFFESWSHLSSAKKADQKVDLGYHHFVIGRFEGQTIFAARMLAIDCIL